MRELNRRFQLWWESEDRRGQMHCGNFLSRLHAEADIESARADLLSECADEQERADIRKGRFVVVER